ncbi:hypothetical protein BH23VER1_BH23VER1_14600 [soil metagenome]
MPNQTPTDLAFEKWVSTISHNFREVKWVSTISQVETKDGQLVEVFLVKEDAHGVTLRFMGGGDLHFPAANILSAKYLNRSFMTTDLIDAWTDAQVADLFTYIRTLE